MNPNCCHCRLCVPYPRWKLTLAYVGVTALSIGFWYGVFVLIVEIVG